MNKKHTFTRPIGLATEIFEVYPNIDPKTRRVIRSDGTKGPKMPDGGVRLRFLGPVPKWYADREAQYQKEVGDLSSNKPNPIENLIQDKNNMFGGVYIISDRLYLMQQGAAYSGIGTSTKKSKKAGSDPFGTGSLTRLWKHLLKMLGRHESCNIQRPEFWRDHVNERDKSLCDPLCSDVEVTLLIDYKMTKEELESIEDALTDHRLGKFGSKFPINKHPASPLNNIHRLPF